MHFANKTTKNAIALLFLFLSIALSEKCVLVDNNQGVTKDLCYNKCENPADIQTRSYWPCYPWLCLCGFNENTRNACSVRPGHETSGIDPDYGCLVCEYVSYQENYWQCPSSPESTSSPCQCELQSKLTQTPETTESPEPAPIDQPSDTPTSDIEIEEEKPSGETTTSQPASEQTTTGTDESTSEVGETETPSTTASLGDGSTLDEDEIGLC